MTLQDLALPLSLSPSGIDARSPRGEGLRLARSEWASLAGLYGFVALLHVVGWGLFLHYAAHYPAMVG
ncbi:MAG: hypothetical protein ACREPT_01465, partial [Rudaea sp.]